MGIRGFGDLMEKPIRASALTRVKITQSKPRRILLVLLATEVGMVT